jgi:hypothetical protein
MGHFVPIGVLAGLLCVMALLATGASAAVNCGGGVTVTGGTPCWKAKRIVKEFKKTRKAEVQGFSCSGRSSGGSLVAVNCRLLNKKIHWES